MRHVTAAIIAALLLFPTRARADIPLPAYSPSPMSTPYNAIAVINETNRIAKRALRAEQMTQQITAAVATVVLAIKRSRNSASPQTPANRRVLQISIGAR